MKHKWCAYMHNSGSIHIKKLVNNRDSKEMNDGHHIKLSFSPVEANTEKEARNMLRREAQYRLFGNGSSMKGNSFHKLSRNGVFRNN